MKEKIRKKKKYYWSIGSILVLIFLGIAFLIGTGKIQDFDDSIYQFAISIRSETLTNILKVFTEIGGVIGLVTVLLITIGVTIFFKKKKYGIMITLNLMVSTFTYLILKNIFQRPRPPVAERLVEERGFSFPSGHATNNMAFYVLAIYLVYRNIKNRKIRNSIIVILSIMPILIGFSRIYLRVHYPSDVVAGFCLGLVCVISFITLVYPKLEKENKI